ncbi:LysR family transcriptional regulator [Anaerolentibacter hominis]|uniref:LysR family transcriptional regulator n=1 Tax=Anaerolentibacter hominis TaxID=3079009 RepID=UPI0031B8960D
MNQEEIETFLNIITYGSISKAAEKMFLSQATISQRLKLLEDKIGFELMRRQKGQRTIELTEKGEAFVDIARKWVNLMQETSFLKTADSNMFLAIGCSDNLISHLFEPFFQHMVASCPNIDFKFRNRTTLELYTLVENKGLDTALLFQPLKRENVITEPIYQEEMVVLQYGRQKPDTKTIAPEELNHRKEIMYWWGNNYQEWHDNHFDPSVRPRANVNTLPLMFCTIRAEGCWSIVPVSVASQMVREEGFHMLRLTAPPPPRTVYRIIHRQPKLVSQNALAIFCRELDSYISGKQSRHP